LGDLTLAAAVKLVKVAKIAKNIVAAQEGNSVLTGAENFQPMKIRGQSVDQNCEYFHFSYCPGTDLRVVEQAFAIS